MLKPIANRVLVEIIKEPSITKSGIILPDTVENKKTSRGKIIAAGAGRVSEAGVKIPMEVKVGDIILFERSISDIEVDDKAYSIIDGDNIIAIIQ